MGYELDPKEWERIGNGFRPKAKPRPVHVRRDDRCRHTILELERQINDGRQLSVVEWVENQLEKPGQT